MYPDGHIGDSLDFLFPLSREPFLGQMYNAGRSGDSDCDGQDFALDFPCEAIFFPMHRGQIVGANVVFAHGLRFSVTAIL